MGKTYWPWELKHLPAQKLREILKGTPMWPWEVRALRRAEELEQIEQALERIEAD